jgi:DNA-binding transcriptional MerR regulator
MNCLSISQLAQFSGIKAHTIRIWEQRYKALSPNRTEGNTRTYSNNDLKRLLNIVSLMDTGHKISEISGKSDEELNKLIKVVYEYEKSQDPHQFVSQLIAAGMQFEEHTFQEVLQHCFEKFGMFKSYTDVISPLLNRVGLMWSIDLLPAAPEHFMTNLIRQKILSSIDALPAPKEGSKKWMLFLPEDEFHETGLLFANYVLKSKGFKVYYLGASVPLNTLNSAIETVRPDFLMLFFIRYNVPDVAEMYLTHLRTNFMTGTIYLSGNGKLIHQLTLDENMHWLTNVDSLLQIENDIK